MDTDDLQKRARDIWPQAMTEQDITVALGVVYGDICRAIQANQQYVKKLSGQSRGSRPE